MKQKYLLILLFCWFNASTQNNTTIFKETQADSADRKIDSILLIGVGSATTRMFLDDLSDYIMDGLQDGGMVAKYCYLGKTVTEARSEYDTISKKGFKAILFFLPKGASFFDVHGNINRTKIGPVTMKIATSRTYYQQKFDFVLYLQDNHMKKIWSSSVEVSGDPSKSRNAKTLAARLLYYFKSNGYTK